MLIYAPNSVDKMLNGHTFTRSVRGHTLPQLTLSIIILREIKTDTDDFLLATLKTLWTDYIRIKNVEQSHHLFESIIDLIIN